MNNLSWLIVYMIWSIWLSIIILKIVIVPLNRIIIKFKMRFILYKNS